VSRQTLPNPDGYVADVPYVPLFVRELAPAWLDHVALVSGIAPPDRREGFAWCDLGCGFGRTAAIFAATHPLGRFHGIDMMSAHIDQARRFAADCGISNAHYHAADFAAASGMDLPRFDYIVAHGVYSWVSVESRAALRAFIDRHLNPGGLVYLSYNALPGRAADLPFQRLVRALGNSRGVLSGP
jgi:SAM-dependent methyltransferase